MANLRSHTSGVEVVRPRARLLRTLGDELISSETVALIELVKNSFDADATKVLVKFREPLKIGGGAIEVIDNGHGMSLNTIQSAWMEPATLVKKRQTTSERLGRRVLGEKGIGRFAASRLATGLEVISKRREMDFQVRVYFDWTQFDNPELFLDQVEVEWTEEAPREFGRQGKIRTLWDDDQQPKAADLAHGTILRMIGLSSGWSETEFSRLHKGLARLVSPSFFIQQEQKPESAFHISLEVPDPFERFTGPVEPPDTLENPHYALNGLVDEFGGYYVDIQLRDAADVEVVSNPPVTRHERTATGPFEFELRVWDRDPASMGQIARIYGSTIKDVRSDLDEVAGISVYRDEFRVLPYGEPGNDWLKLDSRRIQNPRLRLSNNQVVGYVRITSGDNPLLRDQSNREGLIEGPALQAFRDKIVELITLVETRRFTLRRQQRTSIDTKGGLFVNFSLSDVRDYVRKRYPDDNQLLTLIGEKTTDLDHRIEEAQEVLARYHRLATLGNLIDTILHDGRAPLSKIGQVAFMANREVGRSHELSSTAVDRLKDRLEIIRNESQVLATLFRRVEPFGGRKRGRRARVAIENIIGDSFSVLSSEILRLKVKTDLPNGSTELAVDQTEIQEVIVNLLQNSLYWLSQVDEQDRQVKVQVHRKNQGEVEILFSDSGPGVEPEFAERIFDPYFSTKPDGVGLGLTIAGGIINDYYDGDLELLNGGLLSGANFRITLRRRDSSA